MTLLGVAGFTLAACTDEYEYDATPAAAGNQVYFSNAMESSYEISPDSTSFNVYINRISTDQELTVNLASTVTEGSIFQVPASVTFAAGEDKAAIAIAYDPAAIEYGRYDTITIAIVDDELKTVYGNAECLFLAGVTDWGPWGEWNSAGTATYTYNNYWSGDDKGLAFVYRHNTIHENLYQFKLSNWGSGVDIVFDYDKATGFVTCAPQYAVTHSSYGDVFVADSYYYWYNIRGTDISKMSDDDYGRFDEENGIITIPLAWYVPGVGTFGYNVETITIDGYTRADLSAAVAFTGKLIDAKDNYYVVANVALGADVEKANLALVAGEPTEEDLAAIADGTYENLKEVTASGEVRFDANQLEDGDYTFVLVPFFDGEALDAQTASFTFTTGAKETWTLVGTGDYTYTIFFADEDEDGNAVPVVDSDLQIFQSDADPTRFKIEHWGNDVDFYFTWNTDDNTSTVPEQFCGYTYASYGDVMVADIANYMGDAAYYTNYPCTYDPETSTFTFSLTYFVEAGRFGVGQESLKVNWNASATRPMFVAQSKSVKNVKPQYFNRYASMLNVKSVKQLKNNLKLK